MHQVRQPYSRIAVAAVAQAKAFIDNDPLSKSSTDDLALHTGIGRNLLQQAFRSFYGQTIKDYRLDKKLEVSCELLLDGRLTIKQVALKCGYSDQYSYSHAFKKKFNMSPREWQNRKAEEENQRTINEIENRAGKTSISA